MFKNKHILAALLTLCLGCSDVASADGEDPSGCAAHGDTERCGDDPACVVVRGARWDEDARDFEASEFVGCHEAATCEEVPATVLDLEGECVRVTTTCDAFADAVTSYDDQRCLGANTAARPCDDLDVEACEAHGQCAQIVGARMEAGALVWETIGCQYSGSNCGGNSALIKSPEGVCYMTSTYCHPRSWNEEAEFESDPDCEEEFGWPRE